MTNRVMRIVMIFVIVFALVSIATASAPAMAATAVNVLKNLRVTNFIDDYGTLNVEGATTLGSTLAVDGALTYGPNTLSPLAFGTANRKMVVGQTATFTGTLAVASGLTAITAGGASLCTDSLAAAAEVSASISGVTMTVKSWKADGATAGDVGTKACYWIVGTP